MKKNILWIEDFDIKSSTQIRSKRKTQEQLENELIKKYLSIFKDIFQDVVEVKISMFLGIKYILENYGEFDCVILDVDMTKNLQVDRDNTTDQGKIWNSFFEHINLKIETDTGDNKNDYEIGNKALNTYLGENAGFYIVLLLISLGFPKERIIIFTAYDNQNTQDNRVTQWENKFYNANLCIPKVIGKGDLFNRIDGEKHSKLNERLEILYSQEYYFTRLFIYKVYNAFLEYKEFNNVNYLTNSKFNYVCKDKGKTLNQIQDLLDNILFYFPCMQQSKKTSEVYYYALKHFAEPFEADYDSNKLEDANIYRVIKLFRNWSSHNLFENYVELNDKLFRFMYFLEYLLFVDQKSSKDNNELSFVVKEYINELWEKFAVFFQMAEKKDIDKILVEIEKHDWEIFKQRKDVPQNLINLYDRLGKSNSVKRGKTKLEFAYLLEAFLNSFVKNEINYDNHRWDKYELTEDCISIYRELFKYAYYLLEIMTKKE